MQNHNGLFPGSEIRSNSTSFVNNKPGFDRNLAMFHEFNTGVRRIMPADIRNRCITQTCPCNIQQFLTAVKMKNFRLFFFWIFSYFCSKHRLWVHVRTASVRRF